MSEDARRRYPPSLTSQELREIQEWERAHRSVVVRRLLWEIATLRAIVLHADHFESMAANSIATARDISARVVGDYLRERLEELPAVREKRTKLSRNNPDAGYRTSIGDQNNAAERLRLNVLTGEEREELTSRLTLRVLDELQWWMRNAHELAVDQQTAERIRQHFAFLPPAASSGFFLTVLARVEVRLQEQADVLGQVRARGCVSI